MKNLLLATSIVCFASACLATKNPTPIISNSDTSIKLEGFYLLESGYIKQDHLILFDKNVTDNRKKLGFYTEAAFAATITKTINDIIAGAKIVLQPTTRVKTSTSYNGSHIFIETSYGKTELGSPADASAKLRITGSQVTAGTGGWSRYALLNGQHMRYKGLKPDFDTNASFYLESYSNYFDQINDKTERARRVNFFTPKMKGFQAAISYTPDTANTGGNRYINNLMPDKSSGSNVISVSKTGIQRVKLENNEAMTINQNIRDAFSAGLTYEHEISEDTDLKLSVTGEYGKPARRLIHTKMDRTKGVEVLNTYKLSNLKAYNLGAVFTYGNFSCGASYGSLGKSLTAKEYYKVGRDTYYYNGAVAYRQGPIKTSLEYLKTSRYKNTVNTVSLATEYKIMPGLLPYAEISHFQAKGKPVYYPEAPRKTTRGTVGLIGTKLKF
ncbi:DNA topoisomerase IV subunit A [Rickettsia canadensis str. McKiel]|uniref:DNA topoisomerase IV subunit A n=1 Tax=Rickettsia canadensis (strain McKiel) TaxID=293613 RepID=A8EXD5_RICCK|nr:porin [Rickettsia canadensis]ABV73018.1 DNA topoisomerase IV subunit A [Rickettsia canadensis str. McKiel]